MGAVKHVENALCRACPMPVEINPAPWKLNDPNNNDPAHGGRSR